MATKATTTKKKTTASKPKAVVSTKTSTVSAAAVVANADSKSFVTAVNDLSLWRALGFELLGTFLLAGTVIITQETPLYVMFAVVGIVLLGGAISGAHINPIVTISAWVTRRIGWVRLVGYLLAQVVGALLALVVLNAFISHVPAATSSATSLGATAPTLFKAAALPKGHEWAVFFSEVLGATILAFAAAHGLRQKLGKFGQAFTYGGGMLLALLFAYTTASYFSATAILNPAVAMSVQALSWNWSVLGVYVLGPIVGGLVGFYLHQLLCADKK